MVNYNNDPDEKTTWTIKAMPAEARRAVTAYAMRHGLSVAETMAEAVRLLIEREHGTSIMPAPAIPDGIPDGRPTADRADDGELGRCHAWAEVMVRMHDAGVQPPRYLTAAVFRKAAAALGVVPPKPPQRPALLADQRANGEGEDGRS